MLGKIVITEKNILIVANFKLLDKAAVHQIKSKIWTKERFCHRVGPLESLVEATPNTGFLI